MKNITKYNSKAVVIATALLLIILSFLSYLIAPETDSITISSFNPIEIIDGTAFALGFGLGIPFILSYILIAVVLIGIWLYLIRIILKILRKA